MKVVSGINMALAAANEGAAAIILNDYPNQLFSPYHVLESLDEVSLYFGLIQSARELSKGTVGDSRAHQELSLFLGRPAVPWRLILVYLNGKWLHQTWEFAREEVEQMMQNPEVMREPAKLVAARIA